MISSVDLIRSQQTETPAAAQKDSQLGKDAFLKLLVAQIRNQDPLNPADGVQFLTQLAQFTQLEESMEMREDLHAIREALAPSTESAETKEA